MRAASGSGPSKEYRRYRRELRLRRLAILGAQALLFLTLMLLWQVAADRYWVNPMLTSRPTQVWQTLLRLAGSGALAKHLLVTLQETGVGFAVGMLIGVAAAVLLWWWQPLAKVADPYLVVLNAMPKIALGPIFYVWLGEQYSIYGMAIAISVVVTIVMLSVGFGEVDPMQIKLMQTFGASRWQILLRVVLPASMPTLMASLKVNIGLTLVGVIVGEFISSRAGLGYLIIYGGQVFQMELVMTSVMLLAAISAVIYLLVAWLEVAVARLFHLKVRP